MIKFLIMSLVSITLIGCTTSQPASNEIKDVPAERIFMYQQNVKNSTNLIFIRDKGALGSSCYVNLYINGNEVAKFDIKERASFYVPSGEVKMGASILATTGLCSYNVPPRRDRNFTLIPNQTMIMRLTTEPTGTTEIIQTN